jgi:hypothetical protein
VLVQPERLGQGERHEALEAVAREDPLQQRPAANGFRRDPDGLAAGAAQHVLGVRPQRVEVHERERGRAVAERGLVAGVVVGRAH